MQIKRNAIKKIIWIWEGGGIIDYFPYVMNQYFLSIKGSSKEFPLHCLFLKTQISFQENICSIDEIFKSEPDIKILKVSKYQKYQKYQNIKSIKTSTVSKYENIKISKIWKYQEYQMSKVLKNIKSIKLPKLVS